MPSQMPLKPTTIRFAEDSADIVQQAADRVGCTFAQFVREAALMRAMVVHGDRHAIAKLSEMVVQLARRED